MMLWIEAIGFLAALLTTSAGLPQLIKIIKTKHARDVSLALAIVFSSGVFLWLVYGLLIDSLPVTLANFFTFIIWILILFYKLKYK